MFKPQCDTIYHDFKCYNLYSHPLEQYWDLNNNKPQLCSSTAGNNRAYTADWKLENDKLYLIKFWGEMFNFLSHKIYDINDIFSNSSEIFADWYTGQLSIGVGKKVEHFPIEKYDIRVDVSRGIVRDITIHDMV